MVVNACCCQYKPTTRTTVTVCSSGIIQNCTALTSMFSRGYCPASTRLLFCTRRFVRKQQVLPRIVRTSTVSGLSGQSVIVYLRSKNAVARPVNESVECTFYTHSHKATIVCAVAQQRGVRREAQMGLFCQPSCMLAYMNVCVYMCELEEIAEFSRPTVSLWPSARCARSTSCDATVSFR